jgi:hypothetical protein
MAFGRQSVPAFGPVSIDTKIVQLIPKVLQAVVMTFLEFTSFLPGIT